MARSNRQLKIDTQKAAVAVEAEWNAERAAEGKKLLYEASLLSGEMERRLTEDKLKYYIPHTKQEQFHRCMKRNRWALGGNRTGKTEVGAAELVYFARGNHPYREINRPMDLWAVSLTNEVQRDVAQRKVLSYLNPAWIKSVKMREGRADDPEHGVIDFILVESLHGGNSVIGFKSCDQGRERFQGTSKDGIWFDEEPPKEIYTECLMRTLDCQGEIWGTMTPLKGLTWVYEDIYLNYGNDPEAWYVAMSWEDNPYLSADERERMLSNLTPEEIEARRDGKFVAISDLVYKEFDEAVHVVEPFEIPREWQDVISIDPGMDHPLAALWCAVDHDGNIYVVAEHHQRGWNITQHMRAIERISNELDWKRDIRGHLSCLMDAAADQRTLQGERTVAELFREAGLNVNTRVNKARWAGIQTVKNYLTLQPHFDETRWPKGKPKLLIFSTCPNLIREMKGYRWKENNDATGKDDVQKSNDDGVDALRYYVMSRPDGSAPVSVFENPLLAHKKRLAKKMHKNRR